MLKTHGEGDEIHAHNGDDELDAWLLERGYYALKPDYTVNGASYPDGIVEEMRTLLESVTM